jgi:hypothetical protein
MKYEYRSGRRRWTYENTAHHKHNSMTLYYFPGACAHADHIVLEWIGAPYDTVRISHAGIKTADYLAINPGGTVPLLIDGNFSLTETLQFSAISPISIHAHDCLVTVRRDDAPKLCDGLGS